VYCVVETDEDIRKQVLLGARERACKDHLMGMHNRLPRAIQFSERGCKSSLKRVKGFCTTWGFA
jgi:hypothetical protein